MKKIALLIPAIFLMPVMNAQWTDNGNTITTTDNVGIGTTNPNERLHVVGTIGFQGINSSNLPSKYWRIYHNASSTVDYGLQFHFDNQIRARFKKDSFTFEGLVKSKEVKVQLNVWSDFVFNDDYKLPTLREVEVHIEEKGHLQNIPSAKEVEANGIKLGEMDSKLLQKIEELMLYTIQQQKEIEKLKEQNIQLIKDMKTLR